MSKAKQTSHEVIYSSNLRDSHLWQPKPRSQVATEPHNGRPQPWGTFYCLHNAEPEPEPEPDPEPKVDVRFASPLSGVCVEFRTLPGKGTSLGAFDLLMPSLGKCYISFLGTCNGLVRY